MAADHGAIDASVIGESIAGAGRGDAELVAALARARRAHRLAPGARERCEQAARAVLAFLFPHFAPASAGAPRCEEAAVRDELAGLRGALRDALLALPAEPVPPRHGDAGDGVERVVGALLDGLPRLYEALILDARALLEGDPAARSLDEVLLAYPGFRAVAYYRVAHELDGHGVALAPRLMTELAHRETGIDIHPRAVIGSAFAIDHGTGVVIGETAVIGDRVKLYQGVTLGAASVQKALANRKRHPTVGNDVVIYANATILGGETVIGDGSVIGGNVWLTRSVPPGSLVTHDGVATQVRRAGQDAELEWHI